MIFILRLLAGFTSLTPNRRRSQRVSIGPSGAAVSATGEPTTKSEYEPPDFELMSGHQSGQHGERDGEETDDQHDRDPERHALERVLGGGAGAAERLQGAPDPVPDVEADGDHGERVDERDVPALRREV